MFHPNYDPQELAMTLVEITTHAKRSTDHLTSGVDEPMPLGKFTYPQVAANFAAHLSVWFAGHIFDSVADLDGRYSRKAAA